jgi:hypothetical protein
MRSRRSRQFTPCTCICPCTLLTSAARASARRVCKGGADEDYPGSQTGRCFVTFPPSARTVGAPPREAGVPVEPDPSRPGPARQRHPMCRGPAVRGPRRGHRATRERHAVPRPGSPDPVPRTVQSPGDLWPASGDVITSAAVGTSSDPTAAFDGKCCPCCHVVLEYDMRTDGPPTVAGTVERSCRRWRPSVIQECLFLPWAWPSICPRQRSAGLSTD